MTDPKHPNNNEYKLIDSPDIALLARDLIGKVAKNLRIKVQSDYNKYNEEEINKIVESIHEAAVENSSHHHAYDIKQVALDTLKMIKELRSPSVEVASEISHTKSALEEIKDAFGLQIVGPSPNRAQKRVFFCDELNEKSKKEAVQLSPARAG